jgi:hypothetical protein
MWWSAVTERQHGLITWWQGVDLVGEERMWAAIRSRHVIRDLPGVYGATGTPYTPERALMAACLATGGVGSHRSAAWMERFPRVTTRRPEITTGPDVRVRLNGVKAHRSTFLPPEHITVVDGIPCTTAARTALDMSALLGDDSLEALLNALHQRRIASYADVVAVLHDVRCRGRRRVAHVAPILDKCLAVGGKSESRGELWAARTLVKAGLPVPDQQIWVVAHGKRYCIDVGYILQKIGIEFDGWNAHGVTRAAFDGDRDKISELELAGWLMLPVTSSTTASVLIDRVQRALALRSTTSGHSPANTPVSVQKSELWTPGYGAGHGQ